MKPLQILLVEDDQTFQILIKRMVEDHGFELEIAENGLDAVDKLQNNHFDLILMDVEMPEMSGYEALKMIRKHLPDTFNTPIIIITVHDKPYEASKSLLLGANSYLKKPFTAEQLMDEIQTLVL